METNIHEGENMGEKKLDPTEPSPAQQRALDLTRDQPAAKLPRLKLDDLKLTSHPLTAEESAALDRILAEVRVTNGVTDPFKD